MKLKKKLLQALVEFKIRLDRGNSLVYWVRNIILIVAGIKYILTLNAFWTTIIGLIVVIGTYFLGFLDLQYIKAYQMEQELITSKYNPHLNKLSKLKGGSR